jgi:hypothetical protein
MSARLFPLLSALLALALLPALTSCIDDDDDDIDPTPDVLPPAILTVAPAADAEDVAPTERIWVRFDVAPDTVTLTLDGVTGTTETTESGRRISFLPSALLLPSTAYTATVGWTWDGGEDSAPWGFTTGPYGTPLEAAAEGDLVGRTFELNLADADFTSPAGIGGVLGGVLAANPLMFTFQDTSDLSTGLAHLLGAVGVENSDPVEQDLCTPTLTFTYGADGVEGGGDDNPADWDNPNLAMEGVDLQLLITGSEVTVQGMSLTAVFHPDADRFASGTFTGTIDARDIESLTETICELTTCEACDVDGEPFCLGLAAENVSGVMFDFPIVRRSCSEIIDDDLGDVSCEGAASAFTIPDEDGYPKCPEWVGDAPGR